LATLPQALQLRQQVYLTEQDVQRNRVHYESLRQITEIRRQHAAYLAKERAPGRLRPSDYNAQTGTLHWPPCLSLHLQSARTMDMVDSLVLQVRRQDDAAIAKYEIQRLSAEMQDDLKVLLPQRRIGCQDYVDSKSFLRRLAYETRSKNAFAYSDIGLADRPEIRGLAAMADGLCLK
jgi:hypothetical protein